MHFAHTLEKRKVLNVLRLDFIGQVFVVGTFALGRSLVRFGGERNMLGHNLFYLCRHFLDLDMGESLNAEIVVFLKLILHHIVAAVKLSNDVAIHDLIAGEFQQIECAYRVVALRFGRVKPLLYEFGKFVVHLTIKTRMGLLMLRFQSL